MKYVSYWKHNGGLAGFAETNQPPIDTPSIGYLVWNDEVWPSDNSYVENGEVVAMPPKPSSVHVFDLVSKSWNDPRTLQQVKDIKWNVIKGHRASAISAPLNTPFGTFDVDTAARQNITDTIALLKELPPGSTVDFTLYDNSTVTLNQGQMIAIGLLLGQQVQAAHATARTLRTQIQAATTIAEVEAIVWPA